MNNSPETCVSTQDTFRVMEKEEQTSSVSALVSRLNTCSVTDYGGGEKNDDARSSGDDGQKDDKSMADIFPWLPKINDLCRSAVGSKNIKTLENLLTVYLQKVTSSVKDCYLKPIRAGKLKTCMNETLTFYHFLYQDIKEAVDNTLYLEKMTELMAMYIDMEIKSSRRRKESTKKVISRVTSALNIFLDGSENHILDAIMRAKYISTTDKEICSPVLEKLLKTLRTYNMQDTLYVRYLLVYKLWKKVVADANHRKEINRLAIARLQPPANFADRYKRFNNVLPRMPNSKNITTFYMQAKLNIKTACKNFMKISKDPLQPVVIDKPLFFDGRTQSTFSGKGNAFDGGVSRNLMNEIWSSFSDDTSASKKKNSSKKKSKISLKNSSNKKKKKSKSDSFSDSNSPRAVTTSKDVVTAMDTVTSSASVVTALPEHVTSMQPPLVDAQLNQREASVADQRKSDSKLPNCPPLPDSTTTPVSPAVPMTQMSPDSGVTKSPQFEKFITFNSTITEAAAPYNTCAVTSRFYREDKKPLMFDSYDPSGTLAMLGSGLLHPLTPKDEKMAIGDDSIIYHQYCEPPLQGMVHGPQQEATAVSHVVAIKLEDNNNLYQSTGQQESKVASADLWTLNAPILDITGPGVAVEHRNTVPVITIEDSTDAEKEDVFKECEVQVGDQDLPYIEEEVVEPCIQDNFTETVEEYKAVYDPRSGPSDIVQSSAGYEDRGGCPDKVKVNDSRYGNMLEKSSQDNFDMDVDCKPALPILASGFVLINESDNVTSHRQQVPLSPSASPSRRRKRSVPDIAVPVSTDLRLDPSRTRSQERVSSPRVACSPELAAPSCQEVGSPPRLSSSRRHRRSEPHVNVPITLSPCQDLISARVIISPPPEVPPSKSRLSPSPQIKMLSSPKSVVVKSSKPMVLSSTLESVVMQSPQPMVFSSPPPKPVAAYVPEPVLAKSPQLCVFSPSKPVAVQVSEPAAMPPLPRPIPAQSPFVSPETLAMPPPRPVVRASPDSLALAGLHESKVTYPPSIATPQPPQNISPSTLPGIPSQIVTGQYNEMLQPNHSLHHNLPDYTSQLIGHDLVDSLVDNDRFVPSEEFNFLNSKLMYEMSHGFLPDNDDFFSEYTRSDWQGFHHECVIDPNLLETRPLGQESVIREPNPEIIDPMDLFNDRAHHELVLRSLSNEGQPCTGWQYESVPEISNTTSFMTEDDDQTPYQQYPTGVNVYPTQNSARDYQFSGMPSELANTLPSNGLPADTSQYNLTFRNSISETCDKDALGHSSRMTKTQKNSVNYVSSYPNENAHSSLRTQPESIDSKSVSSPNKLDFALAGPPSVDLHPAVQKTPTSHRKKTQPDRPSLQENLALLNCTVQLSQVKPGDEQTARATKAVASRGGSTRNTRNAQSNPIKRPWSPGPASLPPSSMGSNYCKQDKLLAAVNCDFNTCDLEQIGDTHLDSDYSPEKKMLLDGNKRPVTRSISKETSLTLDSSMPSVSRRKIRKPR